MPTDRLRSRPYHGDPSRRRQAGSVLVLIVALLVVFAAAGVGLLTQQTNSRIAALKHGLTFAAKNAADSGAGYALNQLFYPNKTRSDADTGCASMPGSVAFSAAGLQGCSASLSCTSSWTAGSVEHSYTIISTGQCGSGTSIVRRRTQVVARL